MKTATCIDPQTGRRSDKPEYPVVAVRELILNALEVIDVTGNEEDLLIFCRTPRTRAEIEQHFKGRLSINYLMTHIIRPLVGQGKIKLAIPDKPRSKNQKYYS